jgi:3-oxoacyl-[acyl-carrier-protein] synthase-1
MTVDKTMVLNGETLTFPYYAIDNGRRTDSIDNPLRYLEKVVAQAIEKVGLTAEQLKRCGLFLGSSSNDLSLILPLGRNFDGSQEEKLDCKRIGNGFYADHLIKQFGLQGFTLTYNTACTSSANAVIDAASMLEGGMMDYALVVGFEFFAPVTFEGFGSMQLLSSDKIAPFDRDRSGIVQGEALSALFLSRSDIADSPWHFRGAMSNCETHSVTGANPNGVGISEVIRSALKNSGVRAEDITALKAHGTASALNDTAEINGMKLVFEKLPPFFSLKPYIGHTLGSCGSSELLLLMESVDHGFIPPSPNFTHMDEEFGCVPLQKKMPCKSGLFMLNYFGFGGNNTSLIIEKAAQ